VGVDRVDDDRSIPMVRDSSLDDVHDYAFTADTTLCWRRRLPADAPFEGAGRTLRHPLPAVEHLIVETLQNGDDYPLDRDFPIPGRQDVVTQVDKE